MDSKNILKVLSEPKEARSAQINEDVCFLILLFIALLVAACSGSSAPVPAQESEEAAAPTQASEEGQLAAHVGEQRILVNTAPGLDFIRGENVSLHFQANRLHLFDAKSELAL